MWHRRIRLVPFGPCFSVGPYPNQSPLTVPPVHSQARRLCHTCRDRLRCQAAVSHHTIAHAGAPIPSSPRIEAQGDAARMILPPLCRCPRPSEAQRSHLRRKLPTARCLLLVRSSVGVSLLSPLPAGGLTILPLTSLLGPGGRSPYPTGGPRTSSRRFACSERAVLAPRTCNPRAPSVQFALPERVIGVTRANHPHAPGTGL